MRARWFGRAAVKINRSPSSCGAVIGQSATLLIGSTWLIFPGYAETLPAAWTLGVRPYLGGHALVKSFLVAAHPRRRSGPLAVSLTPWLTWRAGKWGLVYTGPHAAHILAHRSSARQTGAELIARIDGSTWTTVADVAAWAWEPGGGTRKAAS